MANLASDMEARLGGLLSMGERSGSNSSVAAEAAALFRTKRVAEIKKIEARLRTEAEEKNESLRTMLGTRYRDLIVAADEVTGMEGKVHCVSNALKEVQKAAELLGQNLQNEYGEKAQEDVRSERTREFERQKVAHAVGSHLKYIVDTREHLFASLDGGKVYEASQRYAGAVQARQALEENPAANHAKKFMNLQWRGVQPFQMDIINAAKKSLRTPSLDVKVYFGALCALTTVTDLEMMECVEELLSYRLEWIENALYSEETSATEAYGRIARVIQDVLQDLHRMLILHEEDEDISAMIAATGALEDISEDCKQKLVSEWLEKVELLVESSAKESLSKVPSGSELMEVVAALRPMTDSGDDAYNTARTAFLGEHAVEQLDGVLRPVLQSHAQQVLRDAIEQTFSKFQKDVASALSAVSETSRGDGNYGRLMWLDERTQHNSNGTGTKTVDLGLIGLAGEYTRSFDVRLRETVIENLERIFEWAPSVAVEARGFSLKRAPFMVEEADRVRAEIQKELEACGPGDVFSLQFSAPIEKLFMLGRFCSCLSTTTSLRQLFCFGAEADGDDAASCSMLADEFSESAVDMCIKTYRTAFLAVANGLGSRLLQTMTEGGALGSRIGWETDGEGEARLLYPAMASFPAFDFATNACRAVQYGGGFALPVEIVGNSVRDFTAAYVSAFRSFLTDYNGGEREESTWKQMIFDLKFLQAVLPPDHAGSEDDASAVLRDVLSNVDASSWSAIESKVDVAVRAAAARSSVLLGAFTRTHPQRRTAITRAILSEGFKMSSLLPLAPTAPRFQYVPAPLPSSFQRRVMTPKAALQNLESDTRGQVRASDVGASSSPTEGTDVVSVASSIATNFGRLSTKWWSGLGGEQGGS
mmetsp:Transcript_12712/g.38979  ORF Transcript_12712/g.38979 Transcript_12712/m.38979 type:complete len:876 (+) Transcript_12712:248-2875(+)